MDLATHGTPIVVGRYVFDPSPRPYTDRQEAGDDTLVRPATQPALRPPVAANDNYVGERPKLVGLVGYARSGKSTVRDILVQRHRFVGTKFAGPLKSMMRALYASASLTAEQIDSRIEGDLKEIPDPLLLGRSPRQAMQELGTAWGRGFFGDALWVTMWAAGLNDNKRYVVDDCRFPNEADAIRVRGGAIIEIRRPGVGPVNAHESERLPTDPDIVIHNDGSLQQLASRINEIVM